jgi:hypothetical protein
MYTLVRTITFLDAKQVTCDCCSVSLWRVVTPDARQFPLDYKARTLEEATKHIRLLSQL